jgi:hypothetical protein
MDLHCPFLYSSFLQCFIYDLTCHATESGNSNVMVTRSCTCYLLYFTGLPVHRWPRPNPSDDTDIRHEEQHFSTFLRGFRGLGPWPQGKIWSNRNGLPFGHGHIRLSPCEDMDPGHGHGVDAEGHRQRGAVCVAAACVPRSRWPGCAEATCGAFRQVATGTGEWDLIWKYLNMWFGGKNIADSDKMIDVQRTYWLVDVKL